MVSNPANRVTVLPGVTRETLVTGERLMVVRFTFEAGAQVPLHRHPHEQSSYIERGRLKYVISGRSKQEMDYRRYVRRELFPQIILETFRS